MNNLESRINEMKITYIIENNLPYQSKQSRTIKRFCEYLKDKLRPIDDLDHINFMENKLIETENKLFKTKSENKKLQIKNCLITNELEKTKNELDLLRNLINELNEKPKKKELKEPKELKETANHKFGLVIIQEEKIILEI